MPKPDRSPLYWMIGTMAVAGGLCAWAVVFYFGWVLKAPDVGYTAGPYNPTAQLWGVRGDAMGPFAALFNAGALIAALWAVHLQRQESHDARIETKLQLDQLTKAAAAQQALATSQALLAQEQTRANIESVAHRLVQHGNTIAVLDAALATLKGAEVAAIGQDQGMQFRVTAMFEERRRWKTEAMTDQTNRAQQLDAHRPRRSRLAPYGRLRHERIPSAFIGPDDEWVLRRVSRRSSGPGVEVSGPA
jgi:hypothetical protein